MPDDGDRAQTINDDLQADALAAHRRKSPPAPLWQRGEANAESGGICTDCDEPINPRRLAVQPFATRCIDCQSDFERILKGR